MRLYQINTSEFDGDQAAIFSLAREAVQHTLLPIVSNRASIGIENPPAIIYLLMLPASLSSDPFWAAVMVACFNIVAVLLTYIFTRRYYGRFAALVAALLYATAAKPLNYSRFIWQQNMLAPFIILFIFALFWGVVERRKGWFFPAVLLLGIAYQLHESSLLLSIPLLLAIVLSPKTLRWRDLTLALASLLVVFSPYILWEFISHIADLSIVLNVAKTRARFDTDAFYLYRFFLSPNGFASYYQVPSKPASILRLFAPLLPWLRYLLQLLVFGGLATAAVLALWPRRSRLSPILTQHETTPGDNGGTDTSTVSENSIEEQQIHSSPLSLLLNWWKGYRATPYRCGLTLLVIWQVVPLLLLLRHTVDLYPYYLIALMPGPFILAGFFLAQIARWTQHGGSLSVGARSIVARRGLNYAIYAVAAFAIIAQLMTSSATIIDAVQGNNGHGKTYNDLNSLEKALTEADHLAQQKHLNRVYITTDTYSESAMHYLSQQMHTPSTLFDDARCLVLPNPADGPAVLLVSPYANVTNALLGEYASTTLVDQPPRLGAPPFKLYIVSPRGTQSTTLAAQTFVDHLQLVNLQRKQLALTNPSWLVARWNLLRSANPAARTTYHYAITATANSDSYPISSLCTFSAIRPGDQLFVAFSLHDNAKTTASVGSVALKGLSFTTIPYNPALGPLRLETDQLRSSSTTVLRTTTGQDTLTIPVTL